MEITAVGSVWPPAGAFDLKSAAWIPEVGATMQFECHTDAQTIRVKAHSDTTFKDGRTASNYLQETIRQVVALVEFAQGRFPTVTFHSVAINGRPEEVGHVGQLQALLQESGLTPQDLLAVAGRHMELGLAVRSLGLAVTESWATHMFCFRAVEILRQAFRLPHERGDDPKARSEGWDRMWKALGKGEAAVRVMQDKAEAERHGEAFASNWEERKASIAGAVQVIVAFVAFARRSLD